MSHPIRPWRVRALLAPLVALMAISVLPSVATAQDTDTAGPRLSPRLLADASWHGRPIQRPLPQRTGTTDPTPELRRGTGFRRTGGSRRVRDLQRRLIRLGYRPGPSDGLYGPRTQAAVVAFQRKHGLQRTGAAGADTLRVLRTRTAPGAPRVPARPSSATPTPAPAQPTPATPARQAESDGGFPLLAAILLLALALPLVTVLALLVRHRTEPATTRVMLLPPDSARPAAEEPPTPAPEPEPEPEPEPLPEPEPIAEPQLPPYAQPRITRRPRPPHGPSHERRAALRERILAMRAEGMTLQEIADRLTAEGETTLGGTRQWHPWSVRAAMRPFNPGGRPTAQHGRRGRG